MFMLRPRNFRFGLNERIHAKKGEKLINSNLGLLLPL